MHQCSGEPPFPVIIHSGRSRRLFSLSSDLYLLVIVLGSIFFTVVLLMIFTFSLKFSLNVDTLSRSSPVSPEKKDANKKTTSEKSVTAHSPYRSSSRMNEVSAKLDFHEQASPSYSVAVYTDHPACSDIGRAILLQGGNAMDVAIASFFCLSAALPHRGGLGGGLMATIYRNSKCITLNAREVCPMGATESYFTNRRDEAVVGPRAAGVPSSLNGLYRAFEKYSSRKLSWRQLVNPTIQLCTRGITVSEQLATDLRQSKSLVLNSLRMRSQFVNGTTGRLLSTSEKMFCPLLADFLQNLVDSENPVDFFYRGQGSTKLLKYIQEKDGFITKEDLEDCESETQSGIKTFFKSHTVCGPPPPSIYSVVQLAVTAMIESNSTSTEIPFLAWDKSRIIGDPVLNENILKDARELVGKDAVQQLLQRFRSRYGPEIQYESTEQGSFSVLVVDEKGDSVAMTSSIGDKFGNRELTEFGFFMNNAMGSFAYGTRQGSPASRNAPLPAKCPMTQMSPVLGIKDEQVAFLSGGADYFGITASIYQAITSRHASLTEGTPLLCRRANGLALLNRDKSLLVGY